ncbi:MAG: NAD(P)H-dependent oxidoreductase [Clostridia bacterium]|nr:NAD(P)H-dependent oxidoreductase [Clostridia bacterium]
MKKLLFINACARDNSRTHRLALGYLNELREHEEFELEELNLYQLDLEPLTQARLLRRDELRAEANWSDSMFDLARQFKDADYILVASPYWDFSFPAILKLYMENIGVDDLTFKTSEAGYTGYCKAKKFVYITTSGGYIGEYNLGYEYFQAVNTMLFGKDLEMEFYSAEALDIFPEKVEDILKDTMNDIKRNFVSGQSNR